MTANKGNLKYCEEVSFNATFMHMSRQVTLPMTAVVTEMAVNAICGLYWLRSTGLKIYDLLPTVEGDHPVQNEPEHIVSMDNPIPQATQIQ